MFWDTTGLNNIQFISLPPDFSEPGICKYSKMPRRKCNAFPKLICTQNFSLWHLMSLLIRWVFGDWIILMSFGKQSLIKIHNVLASVLIHQRECHQYLWTHEGQNGACLWIPAATSRTWACQWHCLPALPGSSKHSTPCRSGRFASTFVERKVTLYAQLCGHFQAADGMPTQTLGGDTAGQTSLKQAGKMPGYPSHCRGAIALRPQSAPGVM